MVCKTRVKDEFDLKPSLGAIGRILRQSGKTRKRRKKSQKKNDLRHIKMQYRSFERLQADTKPLYDIAAYWPQMQTQGLPRHQYTHRDVKSGALFIDYADELSTTYATLSSRRILEHLARHGLPLQEMRLSTDNGSEYGGGEKYERQFGYHADMERLVHEHRFLPPRTPNAHADVESSHDRIETEFFDLEMFHSRRDFFEKITTYQNWWNFARKNYSKGKRTPAEILEEEGINPLLLLRNPDDLDALLRNGEKIRDVGQNLPVGTVFSPDQTCATPPAWIIMGTGSLSRAEQSLRNRGEDCRCEAAVVASQTKVQNGENASRIVSWRLTCGNAMSEPWWKAAMMPESRHS